MGQLGQKTGDRFWINELGHWTIKILSHTGHKTSQKVKVLRVYLNYDHHNEKFSNQRLLTRYSHSAQSTAQNVSECREI